MKTAKQSLHKTSTTFSDKSSNRTYLLLYFYTDYLFDIKYFNTNFCSLIKSHRPDDYFIRLLFYYCIRLSNQKSIEHKVKISLVINTNRRDTLLLFRS